MTKRLAGRPTASPIAAAPRRSFLLRHTGLGISPRDQPHLMPELLQLERPVVGGGTRLHLPTRQGDSLANHASTCDRRSATDHHRAAAIDPMHLEHVLGDIQVDRANLLHQMAPLDWSSATRSCHIDAARGPSTATIARWPTSGEDDLTEQVLKRHPPILVGDASRVRHDDRWFRSTARSSFLASSRLSANEPLMRDGLDPPHGAGGGRIACSSYRGQTAATELATAQIAAHNPIDDSAIAVSDAALLSRPVACTPARSSDDGRCSADREMTK